MAASLSLTRNSQMYSTRITSAKGRHCRIYIWHGMAPIRYKCELRSLRCYTNIPRAIQLLQWFILPMTTRRWSVSVVARYMISVFILKSSTGLIQCYLDVVTCKPRHPCRILRRTAHNLSEYNRRFYCCPERQSKWAPEQNHNHGL